MVAYLRTVLPGLLLWGLLWKIDGRPYSALPWLMGAGLIVWLGVLQTLRTMPCGFLAGLCQASGIWALWKLTDSTTGPALTGSALSHKVLPLAAAAFVVSVLLLLRAWPSRDRKVLYWLLFVLAAMLIIGTLSGSTGSGSLVVHWFVNTFHIDWPTAKKVVLIGRKCIHFTFYGLAAYGGFWAGWHAKMHREVCAAFGLGTALFLGSFDESRQFLAIGRTGSPWDVGIDMCGAAFFSWIAFLKAKRAESNRSADTT